MGKRNRKSNTRVLGRQKARHARTPATSALPEAQGAPTVPISAVAHGALSADEPTTSSPETADSIFAEGLESTPTTRLTLGEMLARQPEQDVLFHPCEQCAIPIRGEASHCDECAATLEEAEALSREEKAQHERHMSLVRRGVVVTLLVTVFGTYFWFNDPRTLLDGLLPGIFGPTQEADASKVAHAEVLPSPSMVVTLALLPDGTTVPLLTPNAPNTLVTTVPPTPVAQQTRAVLPGLPNASPIRVSPSPSTAVQEALTAPLVSPSREVQQVVASPSATSTSTAIRPPSLPTFTAISPQPTQTRPRQAASTPTPTRLPPTAVPPRSATPARTRTPLSAPTGTPTPLRTTVVPTQVTVAVPTSTPTTLPVVPTITPVLPTVTVALPTITVALPTLPVVPTEVRVPEPTVPTVPTVEVPTVDVPSVPTAPLPTGVVPTVPPPPLPDPPTIVPTVTVVAPTVPVPTAQVPTVVASAVPTDVPVVATPTVQGGLPAVPTATLPVALP
ncbi:MAG TPA: hypothetical protein VF952_00630 [Chloroflexia bacterium]